MIFLTLQDFDLKVSPDIRNQITDSNDVLLDDAEASAMAVIQDAFFDKFDLDTEFAQTGTARHKNLLRWMLNLTLYYIYERVPDTQVPERIVKNYDDTIDEIKAIEQGKKNTSLKKLIDIETEIPVSNFRGSKGTPRLHNPF